MARTVEATAARLGISSLVRTQRIAMARSSDGQTSAATERVLHPMAPERRRDAMELTR